MLILCSYCSEFPLRAALTIGLLLGSVASANPTIARTWNEELLHAISIDTARPTVHARNLFSLSTAMYDAWAAFDPTAAQHSHQEKVLVVGDSTAARNQAISHAAYNLIRHRFVSGPAGVGPGASETAIDLQEQMTNLGYDPNFTSTLGDTPAALGNRIAQTIINQSLVDGSNEQNRYANPPGFDPVNPRLTFDLPGTTMNDPNRWQPLHFLGNRIDQFGRPINESTQRHLTPFWGQVQPFALKPRDRSAIGVYHDQGLPPGLNTRPHEAQFKSDALTLIRLSAELDPNDGVMIDISPATRGNTPNAPFTNSYDQVGYAVNPHTGQPYAPELVRRADFGRIMAEFWADGPRSTAPPGHWNEIRNEVTDKMEQLGIPKRVGGTGPVVSDLEWDVKSMFALNGGMHDAAIAAWNHKGVYDSSRPISFIRYMGQLGQSSDPSGPSYHEDGLPLEAGLVEVVTAATTAPGGRHENLAGYEGKIAIRSWRGAIEGVRPFTDPAQVSGVGWILAESWMPYQLSSFVTPPFAGYVSGHSTYSRTGAEVLTLLTGSAFFPGGIFEYDIPQGSGLDFEYGPMSPMKLQFATYFDASDQASMSRIYGGIHPPADDFAGRRIGSLIGPAAWAQSTRLFAGVPEPSSMVLVIFLGVLIQITRKFRLRINLR